MEQKRYDLIIIGAGPAGISAAIYAARAKLRTLVIDSGELGGQIRITNEVVNYPGIARISGAELAGTMRKQAEGFGAELINAKITALSLTGDWKRAETNQGIFEALGMIIATGAQPRKAGFEGEDTYKGHGVGYCATCDGEFFSGLEVFVVGGGFAAAEEALFLTRYARKVTMIIRRGQFGCAQSIADKVLAHPQIEVKFHTRITKVAGEGMIQQVTLQDTETQETALYQAKNGEAIGVFVFTGYEPMNSLVKGHLKLDEAGYIVTDADMQTEIPGVYAAGDIRPKKLRQLVTAVSDGAIASTEAEKYIHAQRERLGVTHEPEEKPEKQPESMLDEDLRGQLIPLFERFENNVFLALIPGDDAEAAQEMQALVQDISGMSEKIGLIQAEEQQAPVEGVSFSSLPAIALYRHTKEPAGIIYRAVPGGHELNSFVLALYNTAGPGQEISPQTLARIQAIAKPLHIQLGVTLSCTMCPDMVQACQLIALHNPNVLLEIIDVSLDAAFRDQHKLMGVPAMVVNGGNLIVGRKSIEQVLDHLESIS